MLKQGLHNCSGWVGLNMSTIQLNVWEADNFSTLFIIYFLHDTIATLCSIKCSACMASRLFSHLLICIFYALYHNITILTSPKITVVRSIYKVNFLEVITSVPYLRTPESVVIQLQSILINNSA